MRFLPLVLLLAACGESTEARRTWRASDHSQPEGQGQSTGQTEAAPAEPDDGRGRARAAARLFQMECASCHGAEGLGNAAAPGGFPAPSLASDIVRGRTDEELRTIVAQGRGAMPAFGTRYTEDAISALVEHIRTLSPPR